MIIFAISVGLWVDLLAPYPRARGLAVVTACDGRWGAKGREVHGLV